MEDFDPVKAWNDVLIKKAMNEAPLESIAAGLPPEGQAWLNGLNRFCRRTVEYDLRNAGPDQFVEHWKSLRDTIRKARTRIWSIRRLEIVGADRPSQSQGRLSFAQGPPPSRGELEA